MPPGAEEGCQHHLCGLIQRPRKRGRLVCCAKEWGVQITVWRRVAADNASAQCAEPIRYLRSTDLVGSWVGCSTITERLNYSLSLRFKFRKRLGPRIYEGAGKNL